MVKCAAQVAARRKSPISKRRESTCVEKHPKQKFSLKIGTVFEDSPLPLEKWLPALWLIVSCKNGISSYEGLETDDAHKVIDHAVQYVDGRSHTNGLENCWSLLKRGISGTYVSVEPFHLFRYLDEQTCRYNNRKNMENADRFTLALSQI